MHEAIIYSFFVSITSLIVFRSEVISHLIVVWCFDNYLLSATTTLIWLYILQLLDLSASLETYCYIIVLLQSCLKQITILTNLHYNQFKINQPSPWEVWNENLLFNWLFKKKISAVRFMEKVWIRSKKFLSCDSPLYIFH